MQQIERDCFSVAKRRSIYIYTTLAFLALLGALYIYIYIYIYIYDISSLRVNVLVQYVLCVPGTSAAVFVQIQIQKRGFRVSAYRIFSHLLLLFAKLPGILH